MGGKGGLSGKRVRGEVFFRKHPIILDFYYNDFCNGHLKAIIKFDNSKQKSLEKIDINKIVMHLITMIPFPIRLLYFKILIFFSSHFSGFSCGEKCLF